MTAECPNCEARFDAAAAARGFQRRPKADGPDRADVACPECEATWNQLHALVDPQPDPEDVERRTNHDGTTELVDKQTGEVVTS
jgi:ssDNA-binding Zn-finger/Zn-ribbon topoisomerase 1